MERQAAQGEDERGADWLHLESEDAGTLQSESVGLSMEDDLERFIDDPVSARAPPLDREIQTYQHGGRPFDRFVDHPRERAHAPPFSLFILTIRFGLTGPVDQTISSASGLATCSPV